jgi:cell division protein ZipA
MEQLWTTITGDLRLALLVIGALFLLLLLGWEFFQRRRARRADDAHVAGPYGQSRQGPSRTGAGASRDPLLDPVLDPAIDPSAPTVDPSGGDGFIDGVGPVREIGPSTIEPSMGVTADGRREPTLTLPAVTVRDRLPEPRVVDLDSAVGSDAGGQSLPVVDSVTISDEPSPVPIDEVPPPPPPVAVQATPPPPPPVAVQAPPPPPVVVQAPPAPPPQVAVQAPPQQPDAQDRRIIALRVVARHGERFTGTSLRQALQGEGFVHGDMQIFHRLTGDGRPLLSAASLTRPGSFDLATMDAALFRGLNLFAVLPGPLSGRETVDKLLLAGHTIAQRLRGDLLDSRGEALTEARLAEMRREAAAGDPV